MAILCVTVCGIFCDKRIFVSGWKGVFGDWVGVGCER